MTFLPEDYERWIAARWRSQMPGVGVPYEAPNRVPYPMVAALGFAGECGEVIEHLKKHYRDGTHPQNNLLLELGDALHYLTVLGQAYGWTLEDIQKANVVKLIARDQGGKA